MFSKLHPSSNFLYLKSILERNTIFPGFAWLFLVSYVCGMWFVVSTDFCHFAFVFCSLSLMWLGWLFVSVFLCLLSLVFPLSLFLCLSSCILSSMSVYLYLSSCACLSTHLPVCLPICLPFLVCLPSCLSIFSVCFTLCNFLSSREDIFVTAERKEFEYMIKATYSNLISSTLHMSLYTPSAH